MRSFYSSFALILALVVNPALADKVDDSVKKGVKFLVSTQDKGTGAFGSKTQYPMTALSLMAMAAVGHQPTDPGDIGRSMKLGLDFILQNNNAISRAQGYFGAVSPGHNGMYTHGIITLCLGEMLGMGVSKDQDLRIRKALEKAVKVIIISQDLPENGRPPKFKRSTDVGGWRYTLRSPDSDLSITVWQVMALRSAQNAGVPVPKKNIEFAVKYLEKSYNRNPQGFTYEVGRGNRQFATAAAGLLSMQVCNKLNAPEVEGAANWLAKYNLQPTARWFFYGTYYYSQGMQKRKDGDPNSVGSRQARLARATVERVLIDGNEQKDNGSWTGGKHPESRYGPVYCTSLAILSLSVKYHFLPIYQY